MYVVVVSSFYCMMYVLCRPVYVCMCNGVAYILITTDTTTCTDIEKEYYATALKPDLDIAY